MDTPPSPPPPSRETDVALGLILIMLAVAACVYAALILRREVQRQRSSKELAEPMEQTDPVEQMLAKFPPTVLTSMSLSGFPTTRHLDQFRKGVA